MFWKKAVPALLVVVVGLSLGCSGKVNTAAIIQSQNDSNIKRLATLYSMYQSQNGLKGPADEAGFKEFIGEQDAERLKMADIDISDIDSLFVSGRDNQPFKIRYGIDTFVGAPSRPIIFEAEGVGGKRLVGYTGNSNNEPREVDSAEYDRLWAGEGDDDSSDVNRG